MKGAIQLTRKIIQAAQNLNDLLAKASETGLRVEINVETREASPPQGEYRYLDIDVLQNLSEAEKKKLIVSQMMSNPIDDTLPNCEGDIEELGDKQ